MKPFGTFQRLGKRSGPNHNDRAREDAKQAKEHAQSSWYQMCLLVLLYAVMSGISAALLSCTVQASQGVQDRLSRELLSGSPPTARWFQHVLFVPQDVQFHCCRNYVFNSMCLVLRVEPLRWIMRGWLQLSRNEVSVTATGSDPLCLERDDQTSEAKATTVSVPFLRTLQITQQPPQLHHYWALLCDCFMRVTVMGCRLCVSTNPRCWPTHTVPVRVTSPVRITE